jgi:hypothetical protein
MRYRGFLLVTVIALVACGPHLPRHSEFTVGMSRSEILGKYGKPQRTQTVSKTGDHIWGPIEDIWPRVPHGATVDIWSYDSRLISRGEGVEHEQSGHTELYFVNESSQVSGIGFRIEGADYEGS